MAFSRITHDPAVMGGQPCIRGLRISVGTIIGLVASGVSRERIRQIEVRAFEKLQARMRELAKGKGMTVPS